MKLKTKTKYFIFTSVSQLGNFSSCFMLTQILGKLSPYSESSSVEKVNKSRISIWATWHPHCINSRRFAGQIGRRPSYYYGLIMFCYFSLQAIQLAVFFVKYCFQEHLKTKLIKVINTKCTFHSLVHVPVRQGIYHIQHMLSTDQHLK